MNTIYSVKTNIQLEWFSQKISTINIQMVCCFWQVYELILYRKQIEFHSQTNTFLQLIADFAIKFCANQFSFFDQGFNNVVQHNSQNQPHIPVLNLNERRKEILSLLPQFILSFWYVLATLEYWNSVVEKVQCR